MGYLPEWISFLNWLFYLIFAAIISVLLFYSFSVGVNILAAPFMAFLAEKVEEKETGKVFDESLNTSVIMAIIGHSLQRECQKNTVFFTPFYFIAFAVFYSAC